MKIYDWLYQRIYGSEYAEMEKNGLDIVDKTSFSNHIHSRVRLQLVRVLFWITIGLVLIFLWVRK